VVFAGGVGMMDEDWFEIFEAADIVGTQAERFCGVILLPLKAWQIWACRFQESVMEPVYDELDHE
jgi:hypothetical protein